ncbi:MAG: hypothetical protein AAF411_21925 [Myxococcota bacterium]
MKPVPRLFASAFAVWLVSFLALEGLRAWIDADLVLALGGFSLAEAWLEASAFDGALPLALIPHAATLGIFALLALPMRLAWLAYLSGRSLRESLRMGAGRLMPFLFGAAVIVTLGGALTLAVVGGAWWVAPASGSPRELALALSPVLLPVGLTLLLLDLSAAASLDHDPVSALLRAWRGVRRALLPFVVYATFALVLRAFAWTSPSLTLAAACGLRALWLKRALRAVRVTVA